MIECWQWDALKRPTFQQLIKKLESICVSGDDILGKCSVRIEPLDEDAKISYQEDIESQKRNVGSNTWNSNESLQGDFSCEGDILVSFVPDK